MAHDLKTRRKFLADMAKTACGVGLAGLGIGLLAEQAKALPATAIRPPGALPEADFLSHCIRCGLCVRDCPYDILDLAKPGEGVPVGTPYFTARTGPCEMCVDIPCVPACPTGALDHALKDIKQAKMGLAVLIDHEECIAFQGLRCEVCYNVCPVNGKAITLDYRHNQRSGMHAMAIPVVHSSDCTGCGKCEHACILDEAAIKVLPVHLAKGELGKHYRLGWKKKAEAGHSLVEPDTPHQFNLPKGMKYDYYGKGLIKNDATSSKKGAESSPSRSALKTLKNGFKEAR